MFVHTNCPDSDLSTASSTEPYNDLSLQWWIRLYVRHQTNCELSLWWVKRKNRLRYCQRKEFWREKFKAFTTRTSYRLECSSMVKCFSSGPNFSFTGLIRSGPSNGSPDPSRATLGCTFAERSFWPILATSAKIIKLSLKCMQRTQIRSLGSFSSMPWLSFSLATLGLMISRVKLCLIWPKCQSIKNLSLIFSCWCTSRRVLQKTPSR